MVGTYLQNSLFQRVLFFTGKGGVGKSAVAWATALACHKAGRTVHVISWNPFDIKTKAEMPEKPGIRWHVLDSMECFHEYALGILKFEKVYEMVFENNVFRSFISAAPGLSESVIAGKVWDIYSRHPDHLLIVDLPSSGHAVTFFSSPMGLQKLFRVGIVHRETARICEMFRSAHTRVDLVTLPEELPMTEANELKKKLEKLQGLSLGYLHLNQCLPQIPGKEPPITAEISSCLKRYYSSQEQENLSESLAQEMGLKILKIPRFAKKTFSVTVQAVASHLEQA